ncbi:CinA family protein [Rhodococcus pseudokoreensis]|uniref:CinA family protein n=1 Tax=Rhodococcus pseudokoreensis TaxID=2811421 RepID=A0A974W692_9NOCA|nr:CinA family protein [Rhodococcus pseudokoreensis]
MFDERAERIAVAARDRHLTIESLTGRRFPPFSVPPSASEWYRGSIVAYVSSVKHRLLRVPDGPVVSELSADIHIHATSAPRRPGSRAHSFGH